VRRSHGHDENPKPCGTYLAHCPQDTKSDRRIKNFLCLYVKVSVIVLWRWHLRRSDPILHHSLTSAIRSRSFAFSVSSLHNETKHSAIDSKAFIGSIHCHLFFIVVHLVRIIYQCIFSSFRQWFKPRRRFRRRVNIDSSSCPLRSSRNVRDEERIFFVFGRLFVCCRQVCKIKFVLFTFLRADDRRILDFDCILIRETSNFIRVRYQRPFLLGPESFLLGKERMSCACFGQEY
jgi:hypothetical protein